MTVSRIVRVAVLAALMATPASGQAFDASAGEQARAQAAAERDRERADRDRERSAREVDRERRDYERALDALEDAEWTQALARFQAVAEQAGARADGAIYWKAYALDRLGRQADALTAIADLARRFPKSRWIGDARALEVQVRARVGQPVVVDASGDDEIKLLALNALQNSAPEQALPLLRQVLQGTQSLKLKERALFVLAQSDSPEARRLMSEIARQGNPDLQRKAIDYLGVHGSSENRALLAEVYGAADDDVKRRVLRAYMVAGDRARVLAAATGESNAALRSEAVRQLGVMGAHDELWQLYGKERDAEVKRDILQAMFVGGDAPRLIQLAKTETDPALRRTAVRNLGLMRASATGSALVEIYTSNAPSEVKAAVVQGLFVQNNAEALVGLARKETDPARKKDLVQKLSVMKSKAAVDYMLELLGK